MPSVANKFDRFKSAFNNAKYLKSENVRVVVLNDLSSLWLAPIFRGYGLKVISLLHLYLQKRNSEGLGHALIEYHLLRASSYFAHKVFSVNKDNKKTFPVTIDFIGNFISPWFFEKGARQDKLYDIGLISRLSVEKNIPLFVEMVANLSSFSGRPIRALILGKGPDEAKIRSKIQELDIQDQVDLLPWVERQELPEVYDQLKCFAITSHHEGFATTLLEAHARGVPAVVTNTAGFCVEFIAGDKEQTGIIFDASEVNSNTFLQRVLDVIDRTEMYAECCRQKSARFDEDKVLGRIQKEINHLLRSPVTSVSR